jgi:hypothetical protein
MLRLHRQVSEDQIVWHVEMRGKLTIEVFEPRPYGLLAAGFVLVAKELDLQRDTATETRRLVPCVLRECQSFLQHTL